MNTPSSIELLAPAGSEDSFYAALDAGADAIYIGLESFNARLRAKNITAKTLARLVPLAHSRSVKVYVTLNTLIKQNELEAAIHTLYQIEQIGVDGVIIADLGLINIARSFFPRLTLHGSTQMAIHNSAGVAVAKRLGLRRVVLARELSLKEIEFVCKKSPLEIEVFVHGALCYSISGACLGSSILGGQSGNRGRCTQVCRRTYQVPGGSRSGYFFSPRDLAALEFIPQYKSAGVTCLKIEGRMKSATYLQTVVSTYRQALDNPERIPELIESLDHDMARSKTTFFLHGTHDAPAIIESQGRSGTGIFLGAITACTDRSLSLVTSETPAPGDTIRIHPQSGYEGVSARVHAVTRADELLTITLTEPLSFAKNDMVYLTDRKSAALLPPVSTSMNARITPVRFSTHYPRAAELLRRFIRPGGGSAHAASAARLIIKINDSGWLDYISNDLCNQLILACGYHETAHLANDVRLEIWRGRLGLAPPLFLADKRYASWQLLLEKFLHLNPTLWANNLSHLVLADSVLHADSMLYALNRPALQQLTQLQIHSSTSSWEDDYLNLRSTGGTKRVCCIFGHPPLFTSRITPGIEPGIELRDPLKRTFKVMEHDDLHIFIGLQRLCLFAKIGKLKELGFDSFLIDLSYIAPDQKTLNVILDHYQRQTRIADSSVFNFKSELK